MSATANALPTDHQRRLQRQLNENRARMLIAFDVAQEMLAKGKETIRRDPNYTRRYDEIILNMAACLAEMAEMGVERAREAADPLLIHSYSLPAPLPSGRAPGGGMSQEAYQERHSSES